MSAGDPTRTISAEYEDEPRSLRSRLGSDVRAARRGATAAAAQLRSQARAAPGELKRGAIQDARAGRRAAAAGAADLAGKARNDIRAARRAADDPKRQRQARKRLASTIGGAASGISTEPVATGADDPDGMFGAAEDATAAAGPIDATLDPTTSPEGLGEFASAGGRQADDLAMFGGAGAGDGLDGLAMIGDGGDGPAPDDMALLGSGDSVDDGLLNFGGGGGGADDPLLGSGSGDGFDDVDELVSFGGGDRRDDSDGWLGGGW